MSKFTEFAQAVGEDFKSVNELALDKMDAIAKIKTQLLGLPKDASGGTVFVPSVEDVKKLESGLEELKSSSMTLGQAYGLFPTYNNFYQQVIEQNKFSEDPIVTKSQLPTSEINALKQKVEDLEKTILEIKQAIQK